MKKIFSFPVALCSLLVVLSMLTVRERFDDPDMWWHLRLGQFIWAHHYIPVTDLFSYTTNHHAWVPHEWLAQLSIYAAYLFGGYSGLMLWLSFFTSALLIAGYAFCCRYSGNAKVSLVGALVIWLFATTGMAVRPQMIGYLLLIVELLILHLGRTRDARWFFALPVLFAVWINCHGSFFLGILLGCVTLATSFLPFQAGLLESPPWEARSRRNLAIALAVSVAALFLNPDGIHTILYPVNTLLFQPLNLLNIEEWKPLQLNDARGVALLVVLLCIFLVVMVRRSKLYLDELLLLVMGTWLGASHRRLIFVFGILAAPVLSRLLGDAWENYDAAEDRMAPNAVFITAALLVAVSVFPNRANLEAQVVAQSPVKAVEFLKAQHIVGPMLNDFVYGGYLMWAAPEYPVFIDGRADVFEWAGVMTEYSNWETMQIAPNSLPDKYGVQFCLLSRQSPMAHVLPLLPEWKTIYLDDNSVIFQRVRAVNTTATGASNVSH